MTTESPALIIMINNWTFGDQVNADGAPWSLDQRLGAIVEAGFEAGSFASDTPGLKDALARFGLRHGAAFDAQSIEHFEPRIRRALEVDNGPINCQLGDHDTPVEEAVELTIAMMAEADRQRAEVHLEVHRDTCTETPEKTSAIAEGVKSATGRYPRINFDFSHPAMIKHLNATNYVDRLFENVPLFQQSTLWHVRPFNGHHCQVPITDGRGNLSPEYLDGRPFIQQAIKHWLAGPRPNNELWIVPELGPKPGYGLSCFPDSWADAIVLGHDIRAIWAEAVGAG